ncbi:cytochrome P450 71A1 [Amborella trichopoda]|uniref:Cytochrome P450 71A1 n=1 Tax=Amborella trichopoda TaxID=13333 RepID=W1P523_AMBTC|nr:cytochrome P450 71A1 [Amborella trichopoda]ERN03033.1 hypothetical protein AMTR_s00181p00020940 [Amborella trichopoda]|eukprot:XP_006841358.1 cytochrome P450 71A1 [Amborella trichopoda]
MSPQQICLLALALPLLLLILRLIRRQQGWRANLPPGPLNLPIIGSLHRLGSAPHLSLAELARQHGPIVYVRLGELPTCVLSSAEMAKEALKTHDAALASRPTLCAAQQLFYGSTDIAFAPYGPYWRQVRKICILELFSTKRVQSFRSMREQEAAHLVSSIRSSCRVGEVDLTELLGPFANGLLCRVALGKNYCEGGEYEREFKRMLEEYQVLLGGFSLGDFFPSLEGWLNLITGMASRMKKTFEDFDRFFDRVIEDHRRKSKVPGGENHVKDLVDVLLEIQSDGLEQIPLTMDNIKAIILDMFAAGTDTTFITLDWGMTELIRNPRVMKKAQDHIRSKIGHKEQIEESDLQELDYLSAVVKEIFRLHPAAPVLIPHLSMEDVKIGEYNIPAKTRFFVNVWAIGRNPKSWDNPEEFCPERFMNSLIDFKGQDFELLPFGAGRRSCPAITFGAATVELALANLLYHFNWELPPGVRPEEFDLTEVFGITMHRKEHLVVVAKPYN